MGGVRGSLAWERVAGRAVFGAHLRDQLRRHDSGLLLRRSQLLLLLGHGIGTDLPGERPLLLLGVLELSHSLLQLVPRRLELSLQLGDAPRFRGGRALGGLQFGGDSWQVMRRSARRAQVRRGRVQLATRHA